MDLPPGIEPAGVHGAQKGRKVNISIVLVFIGISIAVIGQLLLKTGMNQVGRIGVGSFDNVGGLVVRVGTNPYVLTGMVMYIVSSALWLIVLSREELSFVYPLIGTSYLLVVLFAKLYFHEPVSWVRWAGVSLISLGVIFVTRS